MKSQQVSVDYWAMGKAMFVYVVLTGMCWLMLRLFNAVFMLPRRLRSQQENIQNTLQELQVRIKENSGAHNLEHFDKNSSICYAAFW